MSTTEDDAARRDVFALDEVTKEACKKESEKIMRQIEADVLEWLRNRDEGAK